jgi:hypothetical protein
MTPPERSPRHSAHAFAVTIHRKGRGFSEREGQGTGVPPGPAAAQVGDADRVFGEKGQRFFTDVGFPAHRDEVFASAIAHGAPKPILDAIRSLPGKRFGNVDQLPDLYALAGYRDEL